MLKPFKEFICDKCHKVIADPEEGMVEWRYIDDEKSIGAIDFKIVHNCSECSFHRDQTYTILDEQLDTFLSTKLQLLFDFLDQGILVSNSESRIFNYREFSDFSRRLTIPYYEEARQYFEQVIRDGNYSDNTNTGIYNESTLKRIIEEYSAK